VGTPLPSGVLPAQARMQEIVMRPVLLWILGIPIPVIILLYIFNVL
jgi:hypothetical protein